MEQMVANRERRNASSGTFFGQARGKARGQGINELIELIGLPATLELVRAKGGTSFVVPLGITRRGQEQREKLVQIVGREQATRLIGRYGGTTFTCLPVGRRLWTPATATSTGNATSWPARGFPSGRWWRCWPCGTAFPTGRYGAF